MTDTQRRAAQARKAKFRAAAMAGMAWTPPPIAPYGTTPAPATATFSAAKAAPMSDAAMAARHDAARKPHRPGGGTQPRPRWSADEAPLGGWRTLD